MPLSDTAIKSARPREKAYKLADEKGLYLLIKPSGARYWRLKYRYHGKEKLQALGVYPDVSLTAARAMREESRQLLASAIDPMAQRKADKRESRQAPEHTFASVANAWLKNRPRQASASDQQRETMALRELVKILGKRAIRQITPIELLQALRQLEDRATAESAQLAVRQVSLIFRDAMTSGRVERDISADIKAVLRKPGKAHYSALTDPEAVGKLLVAIDRYPGTAVVTTALKLSALLFCRPGELRRLEWSEVNWANDLIEMPADQVRTSQPHLIPLSRQAVRILRELQRFTGHGRYLFPSARGGSQTLSENAVRTALRSMGYGNEDMSAHGFRTTAKTLLSEELKFPAEWIELQLARQVRTSYGKTPESRYLLEQRRRMMQEWADYLDTLKMAADPQATAAEPACSPESQQHRPVQADLFGDLFAAPPADQPETTSTLAPPYSRATDN